MKLVCVFLLIFCFQLKAKVAAQLIDLKTKNAPLERVLQEIRKQSNYTFFYKSDQLTKANPVTIDVQAASLISVLDKCFQGQPFTYVVEDQMILIKPVKKNSKTNAEDIIIKGVVTGENRKPLAEASVIIKGSNKATKTNLHGEFSISVTNTQAVLVISYIGYQKREIPASASSFNIQLKIATTDLDEAIVVAYGSSSKRQDVGARSIVTAKEFEGIPSASIATLLQGRVAGMDVTTNSGSPGGGGTAITIRGYNSLGVEQARRFSNPLWVIDGVPMNTFSSPVTGTNLLADINPDMIESVQVLKDASAASIYGSRAANGVILVTTKKGTKDNKGQFNVNISSSLSLLPRFPDVTIGKAERDFHIKSVRNQLVGYYDYENKKYSIPTSYNDPNPGLDGFWQPNYNGGFSSPQLQDSLNTYYNNSTNWFPVYYQTAKVTNGNVQAFGSMDKISYGIGLGLYNEEGVSRGSDFTRVNLLSNFTVSPVKNLDLTLRINLTGTDRSKSVKDGGLNRGSAIETVPGDPLELSSTVPGPGSAFYDTKLASLRYVDEKNRGNRLTSNFDLKYHLLPGLDVSSNVSYDYSLQKRNYYAPSFLDVNNRGRSTGEVESNSQILNENLLTYSLNIRKNHNLKVLAGFSSQYDRYEYNGGTAMGSPSDLIFYSRPGFPLLGTQTAFGTTTTTALQTFTSDMQEKVLNSLFGRLEYNFKEKYIFNMSFRRDGSSVFGKNNKFAYFPSVAAGWSFAEERFVKDNLPFLNFGKLRASWGKSGLTFSQTYLALGLLDNTPYPYTGQAGISPHYIDGLLNPDLSWEKTSQMDLGIDLEMFDNRLSITSDYYYRKTTDLLYNSVLPGDYSGYVTQWRNMGAISNEGIELMVKYALIRKKGMTWNISVNAARNWNLLLDTYNNRDLYRTDSRDYFVIGKSLSGIYGYKTKGFVENQNQVPVYFNVNGDLVPLAPQYDTGNFYKSGDINYEDTNGDGVINSNDRVYLGSTLPKIYGGLVNEFRWKSFELNLSMVYSIGRKMFNAVPGASIASSQSPLLFNPNHVTFWTVPGNNTKYPRLQISNSSGFTDVLDRNIETVNYIKLKTLTLGYSLPESFVKRIKVSGVKFYASGENIFTITNYSGLDPEVVSIETGIDNGKQYGIPRKLTLGLTVKL
ncbi:SusC/RagA family TonB-linked outer membrane protein [Pedobacter sp. MC2016-24]|uniref:SusC/RagA family TonB-linked outer membrane protein n=1 Tax=Pedobacter sp. MC2016-24 TaxID=2780090 RepID=UPI00187F3A46|nr:SusC/RagA family TonB-linked outer membrane protein [Pedobacter sp. MC2016-24]MBE9601572.1 SusC/RagA family TonB-linked outer membrane protein [Pedobacter sp. MC2016-24]